MEFLKLLESLRTPFWDSIFSFITHFGEESVFIVISFILFWCADKKKGYYCLMVGFWGLLTNQFLKIFCRVPRPWVKDKSFTIVESARGEAGGYSFPSGHTQISVGTYASIARAFSIKVIRYVCIILCVLIPFSRMYLGVHTPLDVGVSVVIAVFLTFIMTPFLGKLTECKRKMRINFALMVFFSFAFVLYMELYKFPQSTDLANFTEARGNSFRILGIVLGIWLGYEIDQKHINFDTKAVWWAQIIKLIFGTLIVFIIKEGLKMPLEIVFLNHPLSGAVRYFLISLFACGIWPFTFSFFSRLGNKNNSR